MTCAVGNCDQPVVVLVHFQNVKTPYGYCGSHGYRRGRLVWQRGIRHVQELAR
jgi:hypothetical protein